MCFLYLSFLCAFVITRLEPLDLILYCVLAILDYLLMTFLSPKSLYFLFVWDPLPLPTAPVHEFGSIFCGPGPINHSGRHPASQPLAGLGWQLSWAGRLAGLLTAGKQVA